ncbi:hypothetical protein CWI38_0054p0010 [Hamiltosporidium tvaerminnensis]|uniref:Uncharacterized protein n=1 Tax=Hamiltosporidium tvaerminnensis TaxID=1176355 RepID=A0A4Q9M1L7_9MICR|nr:hypothetical protein CWI38_0054p0010 [Hamiltosporidium tvaerminnensis]
MYIKEPIRHQSAQLYILPFSLDSIPFTSQKVLIPHKVELVLGLDIFAEGIVIPFI